MDRAPGLRLALLAWGEAERRDLPWRRTRDPWAILVAELMLQQTQVARVVPAYSTFLERFPTPPACAAAPLGDVVRAWAGLGYNRRAVNLHRAATQIDRDGFPTTLDGLVRLPGVGPYTARAVLAYAYEADAAVVDTNVARVLARLAGRRLAPKEVQAEADALLPPGEAWGWNQAMMDLGAAVCRARTPACGDCPIRAACRWGRGGAGGARGGRPDPAVGSAHVSGGQSPFPGSDRQGRGRLVAALRRGPVAGADVAAVMGWATDPVRARQVAATLVADGLVATARDGSLHLA